MSSMVSVLAFLIFLLGISLCCNLCRCFIECMCRWADWWYEMKLEEEYRLTQIVPKNVHIEPEKHEYIIVMNPQPHPLF